jgi:hypothetical protein
MLHGKSRCGRHLVVAMAVVVALGAWSRDARSQVVSRAVGGVSIDAWGLLNDAHLDDLGELVKLRAAALQDIPGELGQLAEMRKVSLRRLEAAIAQAQQTGKPLPDDVQYLAGLQQIRYVFVYPEQNDIVLVGPAEGWKVGPKGIVVGRTTGRPVMLLDDLLVALRSAQQAARGGISCSIDPTEAGMNRLRAHVNTLETIGNPEQTAAGIEQALGRQQIRVSGVPPTSHFARVLVAADYRMKRIAMAFEPSPVRGLPNFLGMVPATGRGMSNMMPRWWLEPDYAPILRDPDGLAWELRDAAVKCMTEEDFLTAAGRREHTGQASPIAQRWADLMTEKYAELAVADPIFGQLRNCMELAVVAALVVKERLPDKAGHSMPLLLDGAELKVAEFVAPTAVDSKASLLKKGRNWVISASGGVMVHSWSIADRVEQDEAPAEARAKSAPADDARWWWN